MMEKFKYIFALFILFSCSAKVKKNTISADEYRAFYDSAKVSGCFVLFDENKITEYVVNQQQYNTPFSPASTFKILNSLISIEEGAVENAETIVKWDGTKRQIEAWNRDQNMKTAFQNSTVWFYQELARRVGKVRMYQWLKKANYGNIDSSGPVDMMWLSGGLRITPSQQIDFLKSLKHEKMPFSKRTYKIVKEVMIAKDTLGCILRAKTG